MQSRTSQEQGLEEGVRALGRVFAWPARKPAVSPPFRHLGWLEDPVRELLAARLSGDTRLVVELGCWLGLGTRFLAEQAPNATVIAIDHWQGSSEHRADPEWRAMLPTLYEGFLSLCWPYRERIIPMRLSTLAGLRIVADHGLCPDLIYIDAEHTHAAVLAELELAFRLFPRVVLTGHDYLHLPVRAAVEEFAQRHDLGVEARDNGWGLLASVGGGH